MSHHVSLSAADVTCLGILGTRYEAQITETYPVGDNKLPFYKTCFEAFVRQAPYALKKSLLAHKEEILRIVTEAIEAGR